MLLVTQKMDVKIISHKNHKINLNTLQRLHSFFKIE